MRRSLILGSIVLICACTVENNHYGFDTINNDYLTSSDETYSIEYFYQDNDKDNYITPNDTYIAPEEIIEIFDCDEEKDIPTSQDVLLLDNLDLQDILVDSYSPEQDQDSEPDLLQEVIYVDVNILDSDSETTSINETILAEVIVTNDVSVNEIATEDIQEPEYILHALLGTSLDPKLYIGMNQKVMSIIFLNSSETADVEIQTMQFTIISNCLLTGANVRIAKESDEPLETNSLLWLGTVNESHKFSATFNSFPALYVVSQNTTKITLSLDTVACSGLFYAFILPTLNQVQAINLQSAELVETEFVPLQGPPLAM